MAAGDRFLIDNDLTDNILLDNDLTDILQIEFGTSGGPFSITRFNTDSGSLDKVIADMETKLETIDNTKTLRLNKIERLSIGGYRGTILYDT